MPQSGTFAPASVDGVARPDDGAGALRRAHSGFRSRRSRRRGRCVKRRRRARTGAAVRLVEPDGVAVPPHRLAGRHAVARDDLLVAALLLRVEQIAAAPRTTTSPDRSAGATSATGGEADQSVLMRTPRTTLSRFGPAEARPLALGRGATGSLGRLRHARRRRRWRRRSARLLGALAARARSARQPGRSTAGAARAAGCSTAGAPGRRGSGSSRLCASSRSSGVGVHRQCEIRAAADSHRCGSA